MSNKTQETTQVFNIDDYLLGEEIVINKNKKPYDGTLILNQKTNDKIILKIFLTNFRVIKFVEDSGTLKLFEKSSFFLSDITKVESKKATTKKGETIFLLKLNFENEQEFKPWRMESEQDMIEIELRIEKLKKLQNEKTIIKCKILLEDEILRKLYKTLVMEKKSMSDEEFWQERDMIKYFDRLSEAKNQTLGKSTKMIFESKTSFKKEMKNNQEITPGMITELNELMRREKKLFELYKKKVLVEHISEKKFWEDFLNKQREKKTVIFGDLNPIYIDEDLEGEEGNIRNINKEVDLLINFDGKDERYFAFQKENKELSGKKKEDDPIECFNKRSYKILEDELNSKSIVLNEFSDLVKANDGLSLEFIQREEKMNQAMEIEADKPKIKLNLREINKEIKKEGDLEKKRDNWHSFKSRLNSFTIQDMRNKKTEVLKDFQKRISEEKQIYNINRSINQEYTNNDITMLQHFNKQTNELLIFFYKVLNKSEKDFTEGPSKSDKLTEIEDLLKDVIKQIETHDNKHPNISKNLEKGIDDERVWSQQIRHSMKKDIEKRIHHALDKNLKKNFEVNFGFKGKGKIN